ncbi:uncharacterized protein BDZ99DRAFT_525816 [Mytilinidion resinicola]|uniref:Uncharacterized protein n=1 Tax=Mytilinidion resinicola TaxID=574789 RepID=A0A6A6Y8C8_9PEZI|nr:uncharacterized protein BDZ99DRAFT_525816 [Mytilinidion resinicola]KAF2804224.1 hypothetical protein BDZ99DRAFT_525816 [Mytilinidion resinicola]
MTPRSDLIYLSEKDLLGTLYTGYGVYRNGTAMMHLCTGKFQLLVFNCCQRSLGVTQVEPPTPFNFHPSHRLEPLRHRWWIRGGTMLSRIRASSASSVTTGSRRHMTRPFARSTVDEKLIIMQKRKTAEIAKIMEDDGKPLNKLGMGNFLRVLGPVREAKHGSPFLLVDDPQNNGRVGPEYEDEDL